MIIDSCEVPIVIERKKINIVYFRINESGQIYDTCPKLVSSIEINKLFKKNEDAII